MLFQLRCQHEAFVTGATNVRSVSTVLPHVVHVHVSQMKSLPASFAAELFVLSVALLMCTQCGAAAEALHTRFTAVRFVPGGPASDLLHVLSPASLFAAGKVNNSLVFL